jgi:sugar-specific transcriptional regulator TrmB
MTDFLDEKRAEIQARMEELKPTVEEYNRLAAAERALSGVGTSPNGKTERGASGSRRRGGGRPKGSGTRGTQALELVRARPGITISELAEAMEIQQNYLYRVMPELAEQGLIVKSGRGWHVKD